MHLRYSEENNIAFLADSGGSVFELSLTRGIRGPTASCRCIFSGSRGEVCTMEPLRVSRQPDHPLAMFSILALATISKIIIITVKPRLKVLMTTALTGIQCMLSARRCRIFKLFKIIVDTSQKDNYLTIVKMNFAFYEVTLFVLFCLICVCVLFSHLISLSCIVIFIFSSFLLVGLN